MYGWQPGIGDPTFVGWFTVSAYAVAAMLSYRCYRHAASSEASSRRDILSARVQRPFWLITTIFLVVLGINKQLDLQSLLTAIGRTLAKGEGWYGRRRTAQYTFILCISATGAITSIVGLWAFRKGGAWVRLALPGLITLIAFVVIRAVSFHHVDEMLGRRVWMFNLNHVLELGGIAIVSLAAFGATAARKKRQ